MKRIAIVHPSINVSELSITSEHRGYRTLFEELSRLGYLEAQTLVVERFSGEGRADHYADLAHDVIRTNPDLIIAIVGDVLVILPEGVVGIAEAALIRDLATDNTKREMYSKLHEHFSRLADEIETAMKGKLSE